MDKLTAYTQAIATAYPEVVIERAHLDAYEGQYNDLVFVNDNLIFRFPKYREGMEKLRDEVHILSRIQGHTTLPIPDPIYTAIEGRPLGQAFIGYRMLPGEPLWSDTFESITDEETLNRLAAQLAGFLQELHTIPLDVVGRDLPVHDGPDDWARMYAEIRQHLFPFMRPDAQEGSRTHFETYLNTPRLHAYTPTLRHGDFGTGNILYDPNERVIGGILDFGFAAVGDPALDIAAASTFGESFLGRMQSTYPQIELMRERATFYRGTYALSEALHGIKSGDQEAFERGIAEYV
jgi:aminoglycoside 2''-phosphotransferase